MKKPTTDRCKTLHPGADLAASYVAQAILQAAAESGSDIRTALIGASAQVTAELSATLGGLEASKHLERAANRVRDLPSAAAFSLAFTQPEGTA